MRFTKTFAATGGASSQLPAHSQIPAHKSHDRLAAPAVCIALALAGLAAPARADNFAHAGTTVTENGGVALARELAAQRPADQTASTGFGVWTAHQDEAGQIVGVAEGRARPGELFAEARSSVFGATFHQVIDTTALGRIEDLVRVLGRPEDAGRIVTLHKTLSLTDSSALFTNPLFSQDRTEMAGHATGHVSGSGILGGELDFESVAFGRFHGAALDILTPQNRTIDFAMDFVVGGGAQLLTLELGSSAAMDNFNTIPADFIANFSLAWGNDGFFTDQGGQVLGCLSTSSGSGFNYGASAACDGGGGGVPEPATWALMLTGFGLVGAPVRRRRNPLTA